MNDNLMSWIDRDYICILSSQSLIIMWKRVGSFFILPFIDEGGRDFGRVHSRKKTNDNCEVKILTMDVENKI